MSDQQCAFDNWQQAAEEVANTQQSPAEQVQTPVVEPVQSQKQAQQTKVEEAKQTLKQKLDQIKNLSADQFEQKFINNFEGGRKPLSLGGGKVLKNDKDFSEFATQIAEKLCEGYGEQQTIDEECAVALFQQLMQFLYQGMEWVNFFELQKKLKVIKNARKNDEKVMLKEKQKKKTRADEQSLASSKLTEKVIQNKNAGKDDLFEGAAMMNSKQQQQERKKKAAEKKAEEKPPVKQAPVEDDDDFM